MADEGSPIRVLLVGCTGLLGDVIAQAISNEPGLDVIARTASPPVDPTTLEADIVVWNEADDSHVSGWLDTYAQQQGPRVLVTMTDGQAAALWHLIPHRIDLGQLSPQTLVTTIRCQSRLCIPQP